MAVLLLISLLAHVVVAKSAPTQETVTGAGVTQAATSRLLGRNGFSFIAVGDTGTANAQEMAVAKAMQAVCSANGPCRLALLLGDNIYNSGPNSATDPQFATKFETPFKDVDMPFYAIQGNHDNSGNIGGDGGNNKRGDYEVQYSKGGLTRKFMMPNRYYRFSQQAKGIKVAPGRPLPNPLVEFFAIDTNAMTSMTVDPNLDKSFVTSQQTWLKNSLTQSRAKWKIVIGHHPYLSNGYHGNAGTYDGTWSLPIDQRPKHQSGENFKTFMHDTVCGLADFYICGHDHMLQWLSNVTSCGKTQFLVSGAGGQESPLEDPNRNKAVWQVGAKNGFFHIWATSRYLDISGYTVDEVSANYTREFQKFVLV